MQASHSLQHIHEQLGHFAVTHNGCLWHGAGRFSMVTFPSNQRMTSSKREIQELLVSCGRLAAVFCPAAGHGPLVNEYWLEARDYGPERLQRQFRRHVARHAGDVISRELSWEEMATGVGAIHADVSQRHGAAASAFTDQQRWAEACRAAAATSGLRAFGCLVENEIAGYVVSWQDQGLCHGLLINRNSRFDTLRMGNVLIYAFSRHQLEQDDISAVNLGRSWFPAKASLNSFKRHAGYEERQAVLAVVLHPRLEAVLRATAPQQPLRRFAAVVARRLGIGDDLHLLQAALQTDIP